MSDERETVLEVAKRLNETTGKDKNYHIEIIRWEDIGRPNAAVDPQSYLNGVIPSDYDVFIGIFGNKYGTETPRAQSGTIEEFATALKRNAESSSVDIMLYFRDHKNAPGDIDGAQISKIQLFKEKSRELGLTTWDYRTIPEFKDELFVHLKERLINGFASADALA
jgi:hypothetical protein